MRYVNGMRTIATAALVATIAGCAAPRPMSPEEARAREECALEAAKVSGYDWIDAGLRRGEVRARCLRLKGF